MRRVNMLFMGGAKRVSIARKFIDSGHRMGLDVKIYGYELSPTCALACVAEEIVVGERWSSPALMGHLHETVTRLGIDIIVPFVDGAVGVAARYVAEYHDTWAPTTDEARAETMFDKSLAAQEFESAGLPVPHTLYGSSPTFPLIAKPRHGSASKGIHVVNDRREWVNLDIFHADYLLQEYITDREEYTVDCYRSVADGGILCVSPRLRLETSGGEVVSTVTVDSPEVKALAARCLVSLDLRGAVTVQIIRDLSNGRVMIMEVNPRLGGGVVATVCAGGNIPAMILCEGTGQSTHPAEAKPGILTQRYLAETTFDLNE